MENLAAAAAVWFWSSAVVCFCCCAPAPWLLICLAASAPASNRVEQRPQCWGVSLVPGRCGRRLWTGRRWSRSDSLLQICAFRPRLHQRPRQTASEPNSLPKPGDVKESSRRGRAGFSAGVAAGAKGETNTRKKRKTLSYLLLESKVLHGGAAETSAWFSKIKKKKNQQKKTTKAHKWKPSQHWAILICCLWLQCCTLLQISLQKYSVNGCKDKIKPHINE